MIGLLVYPEKGLQCGSDERQEQAGKEPSHDLRIDMVLAGLPVAVHPQTAEQSAHRTDDKGKVREVVIPSIDFLAHFPKFGKAGLGGSVEGKKNGSEEYCQKTDCAHEGFNKGSSWCTRLCRSVLAIRVLLGLCPQ